jgi:predicted dehydrogenase
MFRVAIIGAGQIGSRHLQGLAKSRLMVDIHVFDPNVVNCDIAMQRFNEARGNSQRAGLVFNSSFDGPGINFDLAIISTNADIRARTVTDFLSVHDVQYIIFEKVVFQNSEQFEEIIKLLGQRNISAWVNCPRRAITFYQDLKKIITLKQSVSMHVEGYDWGLACNAIHFIDLLAFLTGCFDFTTETSKLDMTVIDSKRKGFIEFTGTLEGRAASGHSFALASHLLPGKGVSTGLTIRFEYDGGNIIIDEAKGRALFHNGNEDSSDVIEHFTIPYQSDSTAVMLESLLTGGKCMLTTLEESYALHAPFLEALTKHYNVITGSESRVCPIT